MTKLEYAKALAVIEFLLRKGFDNHTKEEEQKLFDLTVALAEFENTEEGFAMTPLFNSSVEVAAGNFNIELFKADVVVVIDNNTCEAIAYEDLSDQDMIYLMQAAEATPDLGEFQRYYKQILDNAAK